MVTFSILDGLERKAVSDALDQGRRLDGRALDEPRKISVETGVIPKAEGSARVRLGKTEVVTGVKINPDRPFPDTGDRGTLICTAEIPPLAHPTAEGGPPSEAVIELARVVDRGVRESHMIDMSQMVIQRDVSVIGVFIDSAILDDCGNLFDATSYASVAAVLSARTPTWEMSEDAPRMTEAPRKALPILTVPVSVTMGRIGRHVIVDPDASEWACLDARLTITTNSDGNICALQKGGAEGFTSEQLVSAGQTAIAVGARVRQTLEAARAPASG